MPSRAFINFNDPGAVVAFKARFDGHVFVSGRGAQYRCAVEYAPFQKVPNPAPKKLAIAGTIEKGACHRRQLEAACHLHRRGLAAAHAATRCQAWANSTNRAAQPAAAAAAIAAAADPDYQAFAKALEEGPKALPTAQAQLEAAEAARALSDGGAPAAQVTALVAFLQKKYERTPFMPGRRPARGPRRPAIDEPQVRWCACVCMRVHACSCQLAP